MRRSKKRKLIRRLFNTVLPLLLFSVLGICYIQYYKEGQELKKNSAITIGRIIQFHYDFKGSGGTFSFEYTVKSKVYTNRSVYPRLIASEGYRFEGKSFPVVYDTLHPANSNLLIGSKTFAAYGLSIPDSLKWADNYISVW